MRLGRRRLLQASRGSRVNLPAVRGASIRLLFVLWQTLLGYEEGGVVGSIRVASRSVAVDTSATPLQNCGLQLGMHVVISRYKPIGSILSRDNVARTSLGFEGKDRFVRLEVEEAR